VARTLCPAEGTDDCPAGRDVPVRISVRRERGRLLLGKYADHPAWENLSGMESKRIKANAGGWTIPASHLKFGEDPRDAARRIGEEILTLDKGLAYSEPSVITFFYEPAIAPGEKHYDVLFLFNVSVEAGANVRKPPWYEALEWIDIGLCKACPSPGSTRTSWRPG